jgi:hypothetical protein
MRWRVHPISSQFIASFYPTGKNMLQSSSHEMLAPHTYIFHQDHQDVWFLPANYSRIVCMRLIPHKITVAKPPPTYKFTTKNPNPDNGSSSDFEITVLDFANETGGFFHESEPDEVSPRWRQARNLGFIQSVATRWWLSPTTSLSHVQGGRRTRALLAIFLPKVRPQRHNQARPSSSVTVACCLR